MIPSRLHLKVARSDIWVDSETTRHWGDDPHRLPIQYLVAGEAQRGETARESGLIAQVVALPVRAGGMVGVAVSLDEQCRASRCGEDMRAIRRSGNDRLRPPAENQVHLADPVHAHPRDGAVPGLLQVVAGDRLQQGASPRAGLREQGAQRCVARAR